MQQTLFENENLIKPLNPAFCIGAVMCLVLKKKKRRGEKIFKICF